MRQDGNLVCPLSLIRSQPQPQGMGYGILLKAAYRQSEDIWDLNPVYSGFVVAPRNHNPVVDTFLAPTGL
ncbi:unnamed protein product [Boreogadus saida]